MKSVIPDLVSERSERRVSGIHASAVGTAESQQTYGGFFGPDRMKLESIP
jgi:hypothetical protein